MEASVGGVCLPVLQPPRARDVNTKARRIAENEKLNRFPCSIATPRQALDDHRTMMSIGGGEFEGQATSSDMVQSVVACRGSR